MPANNPNGISYNIQRAALDGMRNFQGDPEMAEELGIATTIESVQSQVASGHQVGRIIAQQLSISKPIVETKIDRKISGQ